jgi:hypothetical protein
MAGSEAELAALKAQVAALARRVGLLEDAQAVRSLHFKYGYYFDACLYEQIVELYSDRAELRFLNGIYRGRAGARRLYCGLLREVWTEGREGPPRGLLYEHLMLQDIIDVAPDGLSAKARIRGFMQGGFHESAERPPRAPQSVWEGGVYENEYVKEDGVWKFGLFNYSLVWQADYETGWTGSATHLKPLTRTFPDDPTGPDELAPVALAAWPERRIVPFHYSHPVTGKVWQGADAT